MEQLLFTNLVARLLWSFSQQRNQAMLWKEMWGESVNGTLLASQDRCVHRVSKGHSIGEVVEIEWNWEKPHWAGKWGVH